MTRRLGLRLGVFLTLAALAGCGEDPLAQVPSASTPAPATASASDGAAPRPIDAGGESPKILLDNVIKLIQTAATNEGGDNFNLAVESLNDLFLDTPDADFALDPKLKAFLAAQPLAPEPQAAAGVLRGLEDRRFISPQDGRHIEDNLLYRQVASRVAGQGDDLDRVARLFDWVAHQVQLVPASSLGTPNLRQDDGRPFQAPARPYDVLLRGMATEDGPWAERSWTFLALCRQLEVEAGLIAVVPRRRSLGGVVRKKVADPAPEPIAWACGVLIGGRVYLFDCRIGRPIPGPGGRGVATLDQALTDPAVLDQLDLAGQPYGITRADLAGGRLRVYLESSPGALSARMRLLQDRLTGKNRMILFRDPTAPAEAFRRAIGPRCEAVALWDLPFAVDFNLFHNGQFVEAALYPIQIFDKRWPLLPARMAQLRGQLTEAVQAYAAFRGADRPLDRHDNPIPPDRARVLDLFATYFLALAQADLGRSDADFLFKETLRLMPAPGPNRPYFYMFRWGAHTNLGRLYEARGQADAAIRYLTQDDPTPQQVGNRLRARDLIWSRPFVPAADVPVPIPPPPGAPTTLPGGDRPATAGNP